MILSCKENKRVVKNPQVETKANLNIKETDFQKF